MDQNNTRTNKQIHRFGHAIVIGSSIAGLTAARVLTDHFDRVTIIERDGLSRKTEFRRSLPQTRHAHILPLRGQMMLEELFPGLSEELVGRGAVSINGGSEMAFYIAGGWHEVNHHAAVVSMSSSRPLLDTSIYQRLLAHSRVHVVQNSEVVGLRTDDDHRRVTGVDVRYRRDLSRSQSTLTADLVVDASGRNSQAPKWLADLGYSPPQESIIDAFSGYTTRIYERPATFDQRWKTLYIRPTPPASSRGGLLIPIEKNRWLVTLIGMGGDYSPTDEKGFLAFARSLPTSQLYEVIKQAAPLTRPYGYRQTANRARHYERLPRYLEGFLVSGDAVFSLNPVYAQGMTAAMLGTQTLAQSLDDRQNEPNLTGLAESFQKKLQKAVAGAWRMATREDQRWPNTKVTKQSRPHYRPAARRPRPARTTGATTTA